MSVHANIRLRRYLVTTAIAAAMAGGAHAQTAPAQSSSGASGSTTTSSSSQTVKEVVITGQRAAIRNAIQTKKNAETILDSVSADDAGKLPDNSVTEVLQRVVGVNMARIGVGSGQSSENFTAEGTGITIRGMSNVISQLNGRDTFSSVNGRTLAWEDIPPELMQGVDVYKADEADNPEGGFGGVINLKTRQPFDYKGFTVAGAVEGNYADYAGKANPAGNLMISDRWNTPLGQFGLLVNAAYSDLATKADGAQVQPYEAEVYDPTLTAAQLKGADGTRLPNLNDPGAKQVFIPQGVDFTEREDDRVRRGLYVAGEWKPNDQLTLGLTVLNSQYTLTSFQHLMMFDSAAVVIPPGATATFDKNGMLTSTTALAGYNYVQSGSATAGVGGGTSGGDSFINMPYQFQSTLQKSKNETTDISFNGDWRPTDRLDVKFALQHVDSSAITNDHYAYDYAFLPQVGLTLSSYGSSTLPKLSIPSTIDLTNAANYGYEATMDHLTNNQGEENAAYVDATYKLSDDGLIRFVKAGLKFTSRTEDDQQTPYNWKALSPYYGSGPYSMLSGSSNSNPAYNQLVDTSTWLRGVMGLPTGVWFPSMTELSTNFTTLHQQLGTGLNANIPAVSFVPSDSSSVKEDTQTLYLMAGFRDDSHFFVPFRGNIGLRIVHANDQASGNLLVSGTTGSNLVPVVYACANPATGTGSGSNCAVTYSWNQNSQASKGGHEETDVLPSFNIQFLPVEQMHIRLAASEDISRPSFQQINPQASLGGTYVGTYTQNWITGLQGDPNIKPERATQFDASVEWYFKSGGQVHVAAFYKSISDFIGTRADSAVYKLPATVTNQGQYSNPTATNGAYTFSDSTTANCGAAGAVVGAVCTQDISYTSQKWFNESQAATLAGIEAGIQKYFDFLPHPLNGLGIDANYTFIDSHQPGAMAYDMLGHKINDLPVTGISRNTINFTVMYDNGPLSMRLAYNWRDSFLVTTTAYQTSGSYANDSYVPDTSNGSSVNKYAVPTYFALPVFQYPTGYLDGNLTYRLSSHVTAVLQASNLLNTMTRLYMGSGNEKANRSWYTADRRYTAAIRFQF